MMNINKNFLTFSAPANKSMKNPEALPKGEVIDAKSFHNLAYFWIANCPTHNPV